MEEKMHSVPIVKNIHGQLIILKTQIFLKIMLMFLVFIPTIQAQAFDFFSYNWNDNNALVVFHYKAGDIEALHYASLAFFAVDDCQKALLASYKTPADENAAFSIKPSKNFALMSDKTYQIATTVLAEKDINNIHSLLIRFQGKPKELPRFLGGCADQGSNCCVAIQCSNDAGLCLPKYTFPQQSFILFSAYD